MSFLKIEMNKEIQSVSIDEILVPPATQYRVTIHYKDGTEQQRLIDAKELEKKYINYLDNDKKEVLEKIQYQDQAFPMETTNDNSSFSNLSMQILGGFMTVLGAAAIAVAFTVLNAATFGITGLVMAGIGAAVTLSGVGLFAVGSLKKCESDLDSDDDNTPKVYYVNNCEK
ncbi:hypothetical protein [Legionella sp.]|uniref:hypothetical protein n=1 Tax=Legionella sp. TaxID=459 RepID=UPI003CB6ECEB